MPDNCPRCGKPVRSTARFCHSCGATLKGNRAQQPEQPSSQGGSKIFIPPGGPVMDPPAAPDTNFPPKPASQRPPTPSTVVNRASEDRTVPTRKVSSTSETRHIERPPEAPRRLERTGTHPINGSEERRTVATEQFTAAQPRRENASQQTNQPNRPEISANNNPVARTEELRQVAKPQPSVNQQIVEPAITVSQKTAALPVNAVNQPVVLDRVMPKTPAIQMEQESIGLADFGLRVGAFIIDFLLVLITIELIIYGTSVFAGRRSLNWSMGVVIGVSAFFYLINWIMLPVFTGQTIGKKMLGIQITLADGGYPRFGD